VLKGNEMLLIVIKIIKVSLFLMMTLMYSNFANAVEKPDEVFGYGKQYVFVQSGYGAGFAFDFVGSGDGSEVQTFNTFSGYGVGISDIYADDSWYRGNFDFIWQGEFTYNFQPTGGYSAGSGFLFRYNFLANKKFVPYVELGIGFGYLGYGLKDQSDGFVFSPQGSLGAHYFITDNVSINGSWRVHHMSNSGLQQPNNSINSNVFSLGATYFFD